MPQCHPWIKEQLYDATYPVRQPLQSATLPHRETSPMAVRAIPGSTRRRIARRLPNRIQIVFGRAAVFYSTIGMG